MSIETFNESRDPADTQDQDRPFGSDRIAWHRIASHRIGSPDDEVPEQRTSSQAKSSARRQQSVRLVVVA